MQKEQTSDAASSPLQTFVIWLSCLLFGYHRYRVKFIYKSKGNREVFNFIRTVKMGDMRHIDDAKALKDAFGPVWEMKDVRRYLCNGILEVEPVCYLGRWRDR